MWKWLGITNDNKTEDCKIAENDPDKDQGKEKSTADENEKATGETSEKLKEVAGNLGNYLYGFANAATKTASKLKETVDEKLEKGIVGDFNRENEKFIREKEERRVGDAVPPWVGYHEEETMKRQILALSADERNFLRDPPSGVDFHFDLAHTMPIALAALKEDKELDEMRFKLVPKRVKEEKFWRNYFYRVSLIKQSTQLSTMADNELRKSPSTSSSESLNKVTEKTSDNQSKFQDVSEVVEAGESPNNHEFISDAFQTSNNGLSEEEKNQMLGLKQDATDGKESNEASGKDVDWELEQELQDELESFELVNDNDADGEDGKWEQEIEDMLELDEDKS